MEENGASCRIEMPVGAWVVILIEAGDYQGWEWVDTIKEPNKVIEGLVEMLPVEGD